MRKQVLVAGIGMGKTAVVYKPLLAQPCDNLFSCVGRYFPSAHFLPKVMLTLLGAGTKITQPLKSLQGSELTDHKGRVAVRKRRWPEVSRSRVTSSQPADSIISTRLAA